MELGCFFTDIKSHQSSAADVPIKQTSISMYEETEERERNPEVDERSTDKTAAALKVEYRNNSFKYADYFTPKTHKMLLRRL